MSESREPAAVAVGHSMASRPIDRQLIPDNQLNSEQ